MTCSHVYLQQRHPKAATEFQISSKVIYVKLQSLRRQFKMLQMENSESIQTFLSRASAMVSQMKSMVRLLLMRVLFQNCYEV